MAPITLSAADFAACLEAAGLDAGGAEAADAGGAAPANPGAVCAPRHASSGTRTKPAPGPVSVHGHGAAEPDRAESNHTATTSEPERVESERPDPSAIPDPFDDADALEELEAEVIQLSAHIEAATYRLLVLIREFDQRRGWELGGHRSCAHWLHYVTGLDLGAAREKVRAARALEHLPKTSEAMARGQLSFSKVRALTRVATPECEEELLEVARDSTTASLERFVREWRAVSRGDEVELERMRYESRSLSVFPDDDGMYVIKGRLPAEVGALVMRAIEAAADAMFSREAREETAATQRRADAMGLLAERAMAAGFGGKRRAGAASARKADRAEDGTAGTGATSADRAENGPADAGTEDLQTSERVSAETRDDADSDVSAETPLGGTRAERYQVFLHVGPDTLRAGGEGSAPREDGAGLSHLEDGTRLSAETARRLCCDVAMVSVERDTDGTVLDIGRRSRVIPPAIDRAVRIRDRGCRFPGCAVRFTDGHHIKHWADGGETKLTNLLSLCVYHHCKLHEGGWRLQYDARDDIATFIDPRGLIRYDARPRERAPLFEEDETNGARPTESGHGNGDAVGNGTAAPNGTRPAEVATGQHAARALADLNHAHGITPDGEKLRARYRRAHDIPWEVHARALEALDEAHFGG